MSFRRCRFRGGCLESRFRKWFERTPHEEILRVKLQRVKQLLSETDLTVREVARQAGFRYVQSMYQAFVAATGETCSEFRRRGGTGGGQK